jgi:hypothetical protein
LTENRQTPSGDIRPRAPKTTPFGGSFGGHGSTRLCWENDMLTYIQINAAKPRDKE